SPPHAKRAPSPREAWGGAPAGGGGDPPAGAFGVRPAKTFPKAGDGRLPIRPSGTFPTLRVGKGRWRLIQSPRCAWGREDEGSVNLSHHMTKPHLRPAWIQTTMPVREGGPHVQALCPPRLGIDAGRGAARLVRPAVRGRGRRQSLQVAGGARAAG